MVRGTMSGMVPGTIIGHEGVGVIQKLALTSVTTNPETGF